MKCFTISHGQLTTGIATVRGPLSDSAVCVGECGKDKCMEVIPFFHLNPPEVTEGRVNQAHPVQPRNNKFFTLAKPRNEKDERILVRVMHYDWSVMKGSATEIGFGFGVSNEDAVSAYWYDSVLVLTPGTVLFLKAQCDTAHEYALEFADSGVMKLMRRKSLVAKMRQEGTFVNMEGVDALDIFPHEILEPEEGEQEYDGGFLIESSLGKRFGSS